MKPKCIKCRDTGLMIIHQDEACSTQQKPIFVKCKHVKGDKDGIKFNKRMG